MAKRLGDEEPGQALAAQSRPEAQLESCTYSVSGLRGIMCVHVPCMIVVHDWKKCMSECARAHVLRCVCLYCICERKSRGSEAEEGRRCSKA